MVSRRPDPLWLVLAENLASLPQAGKHLPNFVEAVARARTVFVAGAGRSGLAARWLAVRLCHLGVPCSVVGEATAPPARRGDLLVAVSCSGTTPGTVAHARAAAKAHCRVCAVTARPNSPLGRLAHIRVVVPQAPSAQFGHSLFEQTALLFFDTAALVLQHRRRQSPPDMWRRHATIE